MTEEEFENQVNSQELLPSCPNCLEENLPTTHFCPNCGMPLTHYAFTAPLERIWALGWILRHAVSRPIPPIVLWGVWFIFGPGILFLGILFL